MFTGSITRFAFEPQNSPRFVPERFLAWNWSQRLRDWSRLIHSCN